MPGQVVFEWDEAKDKLNQEKHGVSFPEARQAFEDTLRVIVKDETHSRSEERPYCIGRVRRGILMVGFTYRGNRIRIYGAGFWRRGRKIYDERNRWLY